MRQIGERAAVGRRRRAQRLGGIIVAVTSALPMSSTLMMSAAVRSSLRVLAMRDRSSVASSSPSPATSGMTATPVSNPDRPSASLGNSSDATRDHHQRIRLLREQVARQSAIAVGCCHSRTSS